MGVDIFLDIEDGAGVRQGSGPIASASRWRSTLRMDRAGSFEFVMPASDPKAALVQRKRIVRASVRQGGVWQEVGAGIIDRVERQVNAAGEVELRVSGDDLVRELTYRSVLNLVLYAGGLPVSHAAAVAAVAGYAPPGWTFTPDPAPASTVYGYFNGETVLAGAIKVAEKSKSHFYRGAGRSLVFASTFAPSGVRAVRARGDLAADTCAIVSLAERIDTYDLLTRIYPRGSGNADVQLTLRATTRSAPPGYVLDKVQNYIEDGGAAAQYGRIERQLDYREIGPIANTGTDIQSAANALFDAALEELRRAVRLQDASYTLTVAGCSRMLRPLQTVRVVYRDAGAGLSIDADLNILESTIEVGPEGVQTVGMVVSTSDKWARDDSRTIIGSINEGRIYQALPQLSANAHVTAYTKNVDALNLAAFRFRFGREVTQLQQVQFEFQLLPFESTVRSVGGSTVTTSAGGGSVQAAAAGGNHTHSVTVPSHTHAVTIAAHTHTVTIPAHSHTVTVPAHSHTVTVPAHSHTVAIAAHTHTVSFTGHSHWVPIPGHTHAVTVPAHTHGVPNHLHNLPVQALAADTIGYNARVFNNAGSWELGAVGLGTGQNLDTGAGSGATTTASGGGSTPTSSSGGGGTHASDSGLITTLTSSNGGGQTPTSSVLSQQTPTSSVLSQQTPTSSTYAQQTPTTSSGGGQVASSSGGGGSLETSSTNGNHTHSVTVPDHTHSLTPVVQANYGIFRDAPGNVFALGELDYRINGGAWNPLSTAQAAGGGWWILDITAALIDPITLRPAQDENLLEVRSALEIHSPLAWVVAPGGGRYELYFPNPHGLAVGDDIIVNVPGRLVNYQAPVSLVVGAFVYVDAPGDMGSGVGASVVRARRATIDAQLAVRSTIQAIAYA